MTTSSRTRSRSTKQKPTLPVDNDLAIQIVANAVHPDRDGDRDLTG